MLIQILDINFDINNFDISDFAKKAYDICPDFNSVVENEKELVKYIIDRKGLVDFWWD